MDIVMLAAGTSSRMGRTNKMLLPYNGETLVAHCCLEALRFLERYSAEKNESCTLIVVTGYRRRSVGKALLPCKEFIGRTSGKLEMLIVENRSYRSGQFRSTKVGVSQVSDGSPFFISLADMPYVTASHYGELARLLGTHDAVRPFVERNGENVPGHPVLHTHALKERILRCPDDWTVSRILKQCDVLEPSFPDSSWIQDIDFPEDYRPSES